MLTLTLFKSKYIWATTLTFQSHVTSPVTWPYDTPGAILYRCSVLTVPESVSQAIFETMGHKHIGVTIDLSRSRDVIGHVTNLSVICHFLLVSHWNQVSIFNRFRDICLQINLGHDLDLSRSHDVIRHVTNRSAICHFLLVSHWNRVYLEPFSRYLHLNISGSLPWPFSHLKFASRDVTDHVTIWYPSCHFLMGPKDSVASSGVFY